MSIFKSKTQEEADRIPQESWDKLLAKAENNPNSYYDKIDPIYNYGQQYAIHAEKNSSWIINYLKFGKNGWKYTPGQYYATTTFFYDNSGRVNLKFPPKFSDSIVIDGGSNWEIYGVREPLKNIYSKIGEEVHENQMQDFLKDTLHSVPQAKSKKIIKIAIDKLIKDNNYIFPMLFYFYKELKQTLLELMETNEKYKAKKVLNEWDDYDDDYDEDEEEDYYVEGLPPNAKAQEDYYFNKGKYSREYTELWDEMIPSQGQADSVQGEVLRCISKLSYDRFNNGFGNPMPACAKLINFYSNLWTGYLDNKMDWRMFYNHYKSIGFGEGVVQRSWIGDQYWDNIITAIIEWIMDSKEEILPEEYKNMY